LELKPNNNFKRKKPNNVWLPYLKIAFEKPKLLFSVRRVDYPIKSKGYRKKSTFPVECE
jgi:hypothetical protein